MLQSPAAPEPSRLAPESVLRRFGAVRKSVRLLPPAELHVVTLHLSYGTFTTLKTNFRGMQELVLALKR